MPVQATDAVPVPIGDHAQARVRAEFAEFVAASYPALVRTGYLLTGDRGHAEDLVQHCLLGTYRAWRRLERPYVAEAYTRTSMVRLATKWRRRRWRGEVPTDPLPELAAADHATALVTTDLVRRALGSLPAAQRAVLVLRFFDDRSEAEIATMLRCSVGTVKSRASRALAALRARGLLDDGFLAPDRPLPASQTVAYGRSVAATRGQSLKEQP